MTLLAQVTLSINNQRVPLRHPLCSLLVIGTQYATTPAPLNLPPHIVEVRKGVFSLVKLFLILTVGWFIYAFIRFTWELTRGLDKASASIKYVQMTNVKVLPKEAVKDPFKSEKSKND